MIIIIMMMMIIIIQVLRTTTRKAIDIGVAADAGYCGKVGNDIDSVEADIVQMINLANTIYSDQANIFLRLRTIKVNRSVWLCR